MAVEISPKELDSFSLRNQPRAHLRIRSRPVRDRFRQVARRFALPEANGAGPKMEVSEAFDAAGPKFRGDGWAFVEGFFTAESWKALVDGWPKRVFFNAPADLQKSYDWGFKWVRGKPEPEYLKSFPALDAAYAALRSDEFEQRVAALWDDGLHRTSYSVSATWANAHSALILHKDTVAHDKNSGSFMNIIFFVDGTGGPRAGGTVIALDNEYENVLLEPQNLRNTALMYKSDAPLFHGFQPMRPGTFRWTINAQYADPNWPG